MLNNAHLLSKQLTYIAKAMCCVRLSPREREVHGILEFLRATGAITGCPSVTGPSDDKSLLAIAQLAVLRTNTSRGVFSVFDESHQYIIVEVTRSSSLTQGRSLPRTHFLTILVSDEATPSTSIVCPMMTAKIKICFQTGW